MVKRGIVCLSGVLLSLAMVIWSDTVSAATASAAISGVSNVNMTITPSAGTQTIIGSTALTYSVTDAKEYSIYMNASSSNTSMAGSVTNTDTVDSISTDTVFNSFSNNTWGQCIGASVCGDSDTFVPIQPSASTSSVLTKNLANTVNHFADSGTYYLTFGAKINYDLSADNYTSTILVSLIAEDKPAILTDITNMQEMTTQICEDTPTPLIMDTTIVYTKRLVDTRDSKLYWVAKLADGNCWMTQNLAHDVNTAVTYTPDDTNISANWKPSLGTYTYGRTGTTYVNTPATYNLGTFVVKNPTSGVNLCSSAANTHANCYGAATGGLVNVATYADTYVATGEGNAILSVDTATQEYDPHYPIGNYYSWGSATAGTGLGMHTGKASGSICPKGWQLPVRDTDRSYKALYNAYELTSGAESVYKIGSAPIYLFMSGFVWPYSGHGVWNTGEQGRYHVNQAMGTFTYGITASALMTVTATIINIEALHYMWGGNTIRCVAI